MLITNEIILNIIATTPPPPSSSTQSYNYPIMEIVTLTSSSASSDHNNSMDDFNATTANDNNMRFTYHQRVRENDVRDDHDNKTHYSIARESLITYIMKNNCGTTTNMADMIMDDYDYSLTAFDKRKLLSEFFSFKLMKRRQYNSSNQHLREGNDTYTWKLL